MSTNYVPDINYDGRIYITAQEAEGFGWIVPTAALTVVSAEGEETSLTLTQSGVGELKRLAARVERALAKMPDAPEV